MALTHHDVLARLSPEDKARLTERSDSRGLGHLTVYLVVLGTSSLLIAAKVPFWGLLLPLQGILIVFLFTLCHECTHQTPFRSAWINEWVGHATGFLLLMPFLWFRYFHLAHHRHTNDPARDPELTEPRPETWRDYLWHVSGLPFWRAMVKVVVQNAFGRAEGDYLPERALHRIRREARVMVVLFGLVLLSLLVSPWAFWIWLLPAMLGQPFLRLYLLAEHGRCPQVANMLENTRTTFTNRIVRFLAWNMPYHIEHHSFPNVPFHALPRLHEHMQSDLVTTSRGYVAFTKDFAAKL